MLWVKTTPLWRCGAGAAARRSSPRSASRALSIGIAARPRARGQRYTGVGTYLISLFLPATGRFQSCFRIPIKLDSASLAKILLLATEQHRRALPVTTHAGPSVLHAQSARGLEQGSRSWKATEPHAELYPAPHRPVPDLSHTLADERQLAARLADTWLSRLAHTEQMATEQQARALYAPSLSTRHATPATGLLLTELARAP